jgi:hypothetical protein
MHIAEKYLSLARDAQSFGDNVAAENYLQHAEHYNRIVMAAQAQLQQAQQMQFRDGPEEGEDEDRQMNGRFRDRFEYNGDGRAGDEEGEERFEAGEEDEERAGFPPRQMRPERPERPQRFERRDRPDRGERFERPERVEAPERAERTAAPAEGNGGGEVRDAAPFAMREDGDRPRRRRRPPRPDGGVEAADGGPQESTRDGEAALAAFPD